MRYPLRFFEPDITAIHAGIFLARAASSIAKAYHSRTSPRASALPLMSTAARASPARFATLDGALGRLPHTLCYAVKANGNLSILRLLAGLGSGFDIVSGGELYRLERAGIPGDRVVFSGVGKSREEIREALRARIRLFNVESEAELELLAAEAARMGTSRARGHPR